MNDSNKRNHKARERLEKRRQRREAMVSVTEEGVSKFGSIAPTSIVKSLGVVGRFFQDGIWHLTHRASADVFKIIGSIIAVIVLLFFASLIFSSNIGPNINSLGIDLGGQSIEAGTDRLVDHWTNDVQIQVMLDGEVITTARPDEIGLHLDAIATALLAKEAGLAGLPFGYEVTPIIEADYSEAQNYLLTIGDQIYIPPYEAGYEWRDNTLVGVEGRASRELDVVLTVQRVMDEPLALIESGRLELFTNSTAPVASDPAPYYDQALAFVTGNFTIEGYDPFRNEFQYWQTTREEMARWLVVGSNGLNIREEGLEAFVNTVNGILTTPQNPRYLDITDTLASIQTAFTNGQNSSLVRIRYLPFSYTVASGDTGFSIGRRTGLPFRHIAEANPSTDWNTLVVGQQLNMPTRDLVVPDDPIANKRIVVDLDRRYLVAYENGEMVFNWAISVGQTDAPTYPGIYQILDKTDVAYGSSFSLCGDNGCGQWEMDWFMSIYEIAPGLTNGFHGAVRLPNGAYLNGGSARLQSTFGCVMSDTIQAEQLYRWSDVGTIVEIYSREFPPQSDLARQALDYINQNGL